MILAMPAPCSSWWYGYDSTRFMENLLSVAKVACRSNYLLPNYRVHLYIKWNIMTAATDKWCTSLRNHYQCLSIREHRFVQSASEVEEDYLTNLANMKKVCIIGAGAAGLASIRHVKDSSHLDGIVYEQADQIGGLLVYSDKTVEENGEPVHSSMYKSLRTHLPKQLMAYPDFPFGDTKGSFVTNEEMLTYMQEYARFHKLDSYIKFNHKVLYVKPECTANSKDVQWIVSVQDKSSKQIFTKTFDSVIVCNGRCFQPYLPPLNLNDYQGFLIHSKDYRKPDIFKGQRVVVVGGGLSGLDLSTEIASTAKSVFFCHNQAPLDSSWLPENVTQVLPVVKLTRTGVLIDCGGSIEADSILLCTGYEYSYPFLSLEECKMEILHEGKYVKPLYRHFIHSKYPTLSFFGLQFLNAAFPLFDCQARYYVAFLEGKVTLPSEAEMNNEIEYDFEYKRNNGIPPTKAHSSGNNPWPLYKALGEEAGFDTSWIPIMRSIYNHVNDRRVQFPTLYKNDQITLKSLNEYEYEAVEEL